MTMTNMVGGFQTSGHAMYTASRAGGVHGKWYVCSVNNWQSTLNSRSRHMDGFHDEERLEDEVGLDSYPQK